MWWQGRLVKPVVADHVIDVVHVLVVEGVGVVVELVVNVLACS